MNITFTEEELQAFVDRVVRASEDPDLRQVSEAILRRMERQFLTEVPGWAKDLAKVISKAKSQPVKWREVL